LHSLIDVVVQFGAEEPRQVRVAWADARPGTRYALKSWL